MDLSPGMRISPVKASERWAVAGFGVAEWDMDFSLSHFWRYARWINQSGSFLAQELSVVIRQCVF